eukprot:PhM_4_TR610/c0_g1_i1/m.82817
MNTKKLLTVFSIVCLVTAVVLNCVAVISTKWTKLSLSSGGNGGTITIQKGLFSVCNDTGTTSSRCSLRSFDGDVLCHDGSARSGDEYEARIMAVIVLMFAATLIPAIFLILSLLPLLTEVPGRWWYLTISITSLLCSASIITSLVLFDNTERTWLWCGEGACFARGDDQCEFRLGTSFFLACGAGASMFIVSILQIVLWKSCTQKVERPTTNVQHTYVPDTQQGVVVTEPVRMDDDESVVHESCSNTNHGGSDPDATSKDLDDIEDDVKEESAASWVYDEDCNLFWSNTQHVYYDQASGHYYDPRREEWYDPEAQRWYVLDPDPDV